jgi:hypothetical protein
MIGVTTGCNKAADRLLLLDVRASGALDSSQASVRFSAPDWPTRAVNSPLGPQGIVFDYDGPPGDGPVTVTVEALDGNQCVLGAGTATVPGTVSGTTSLATIVFVRPLVDSGCAFTDAGIDAPASAADAGNDAGADGGDGGDAGDAGDSAVDSAVDAGIDSVVVPTDAGADAASIG